MVVIIWKLDLQLPVQSVTITTKVVSSTNTGFIVHILKHNMFFLFQADFILMCLSPQYKMEVEAHECDGTIDDKELHIQYIYSLMLTEMKQNGHRNSRVIPLLNILQ
jgi:hypothetical protein